MSYINDIEITIARRAFFLACTRWSAAYMKDHEITSPGALQTTKS